MLLSKSIRTIDTHTGGEPTRTVVGGVLSVPGKTMQEKYLYMQEHYQWLNNFLSLEPRGNSIMSGAILVEPCTEGADIGAIYFETGNWLPMCGHDTIGLATALIESGMVNVKEPVTYINLDTPSGMVRISAEVRDHRAGNISFLNAPAFVMKRDCEVDSTEFGKVHFDIAWGGNVYAIVPVGQLGIKLERKNAKRFVSSGVRLRDEINAKVSVRHPLLPFVNSVTHIEFTGPSETPGVYCRNTVLITGEALDRSPCGTGSSAKLALLHAKGELGVGQKILHESILGSIFECSIEEETEVAGIPAVIPRIGGQAWITGFNNFVLDPSDLFPEGFEL